MIMDPVASFYLGVAITSAAWSPSTSYPSGEQEMDPQDWRLDLVVTTTTQELRLLSAQGPGAETSSRVLGTSPEPLLDVAWCAASGYESYVATGGAHGAVHIWHLDEDEAGEDRVTCRTIYLDHAVLTVAFHTEVPKLLLAVESHGVARLMDWLSGADTPRSSAWFHDPATLGAYAADGVDVQGSASWQRQDGDVLGAMLGPRWNVWHRTQGTATPVVQGVVHGAPSTCGGSLRFCPTSARLLAVHATQVPSAVVAASSGAAAGPPAEVSGAASFVQVLDMAFPQSPRVVDVHHRTRFHERYVDLDATGDGRAATVPASYGAASLDWLPKRVGAYDVLLVAVGYHVIPVPAM